MDEAYDELNVTVQVGVKPDGSASTPPPKKRPKHRKKKYVLIPFHQLYGNNGYVKMTHNSLYVKML